MIQITAKVKRWNHNRRLASVKMISDEPHVLRFIGDGGREMSGDDANEMLVELMEKGYAFQVVTEFVDVSIEDLMP